MQIYQFVSISIACATDVERCQKNTEREPRNENTITDQRTGN